MSPSPQKDESGTGDSRLDLVRLVLGVVFGLLTLAAAFAAFVYIFLEILALKATLLAAALHQQFPEAKDSPFWALAAGSFVLCASWVAIFEILGSPPLNRLRRKSANSDAPPALGILPKAAVPALMLLGLWVCFLFHAWVDIFPSANTWWYVCGTVALWIASLRIHVRLRPRVYAQPLFQWARKNYLQQGEEAADPAKSADASEGEESDFDASDAQSNRIRIWAYFVMSTGCCGVLLVLASTREGGTPPWLWPLAALGVVLFCAGFFVFRTQALDPVRSGTIDLQCKEGSGQVFLPLLVAWMMTTGLALCGPWLVYFQENPARYGWPFLAGAALLLFITRPWALTPHPK